MGLKLLTLLLNKVIYLSLPIQVRQSKKLNNDVLTIVNKVKVVLISNIITITLALTSIIILNMLLLIKTVRCRNKFPVIHFPLILASLKKTIDRFFTHQSTLTTVLNRGQVKKQIIFITAVFL